MALRTKKGSVTADARRRYGAKRGSGLKPGSYPVFDVQSAISAIRLRGKAPNKAAVLNKVARSKVAGNPRVKAALKRARAVDAKRKRRR